MVASSSFLVIFLIFALYVLIKNKCNFNKQVNVVFSIMLLTMAGLSNSSILTFLNSLDFDGCENSHLGYTILHQCHIFVIVICTYLVCRMLSIYYKINIVFNKSQPNWKTKTAQKISDYQNIIIAFYLITMTAFIWTLQYYLRDKEPINALTQQQEIIFISLSIPKIIYEMGVWILFIILFKKLNHLATEQQENQEG